MESFELHDDVQLTADAACQMKATGGCILLAFAGYDALAWWCREAFRTLSCMLLLLLIAVVNRGTASISCCIQPGCRA
jgi:hypothetical protein